MAIESQQPNRTQLERELESNVDPVAVNVKTESPASSSDPQALTQENSSSGGDQKHNKENDSTPGTARSESQGSRQSRKRKKVGIACVYCRRSHMICDEGRPCQRCLKRNIGHLCHDEPTNGGKKGKRGTEGIDDVLANPQQRPLSTLAAIATVTSSPSPGLHTIVSSNPTPTNASNGKLDNNSADRLKSLGIYHHQPGSEAGPVEILGYQAPTPQPPAQVVASKTISPTTINQQPFFYSEHAGSEFNSLTEFLSMIDDTDMINSINLTNDPMLHKLETFNSNNNSSTNLAQIDVDPSFENSLFVRSSASASATPHLSKRPSGSLTQLAVQNNIKQVQQQTPQPQPFQAMDLPRFDGYFPPQHSPIPLRSPASATPTAPSVPVAVTGPNSQPYVSDSARDKFFLTAADPTTEISPEERLKQVINAKLEAGLLKPYNYAKGYQRLQTYMDNHMATSSRQRILKPLSTFRPGFRAIAKTLKDLDLILVEENFERMLLDYDRVFTSMAIPACLWRRTGEIYRGNKEFASLVEVSIDELKNGRLTIYELMTEESSVNFWEKYGAIAFDKTQKAVLTSCNLRSRDGRKKRNCCFSFTIRRDRYNIPSCIVGNFIPIQ